MNRHKFAFFFEDLYKKSEPKESNLQKKFVIKELSLIHRLNQVVRVKSEDKLLLFDKNYNLEIEVESLDKSTITCKKLVFSKNKKLFPQIHLLIPLLEKNPLEKAFSAAAVFGVNNIYPFISKKSHRKNFFKNELTRLEKIVISSMEQSKQFFFPEIEPLNTLETHVNKLNNLEKVEKKIFLDPSRTPLLKIICNIQNKKENKNNIICIVGPEGDLEKAEKDFLKKKGFEFASLGPSILRSELAATICLGILRNRS